MEGGISKVKVGSYRITKINRTTIAIFQMYLLDENLYLSLKQKPLVMKFEKEIFFSNDFETSNKHIRFTIML